MNKGGNNVALGYPGSTGPTQTGVDSQATRTEEFRQDGGRAGCFSDKEQPLSGSGVQFADGQEETGPDNTNASGQSDNGSVVPVGKGAEMVILD